MKKIILLIILLLAFLSHCLFRTRIKSKIRPPIPYLTSLNILLTTSPLFEATVTNEVTFNYRRRVGAEYYTILLFLTPPPKNNKFLTTVQNECLGGISSFYSLHGFKDQTSITFSDNQPTLYKCLKVYNGEVVLSKTETVKFSDIFTSGESYYWLALGYNNQFRLTFSSQLLKFTVQ